MVQDRRTANPINSERDVQRQTEMQLHISLEAARTEYESALERYMRAAKRCYRLQPANLAYENGNGHSQPTGEPSVSQSVKARHSAFEKYWQAVDNFNKFILDAWATRSRTDAAPRER
jgi:hypothetical protein